MTPLELKKFYSSEEFKKNYTYNKNDLGITYSKDETMFKLYAPTAKKVEVNLYNSCNYNLNDLKSTFEMTKLEKGVWCLKINEDLDEVYYDYNVYIDGEVYKTYDPYAVACGVNGKRSMVVNLNTTNPDGWENDTYGKEKINSPIIYELHIKDFSYDKNSGIDEKYRGKYLAFTETGTTLNNDKIHITGIDYLKSLNITHVHLLPCFDFGSVNESLNDGTQYNWGYDPVNYNVPEGSYSTNPFDGKVRIKEFKEMVLALHKAGIKVIMDVVYNHTYSLDSSFQKTVPYYYYRQNEDGTLCNGSACGNDTASERIMFGNFMKNSIIYWTKEYHIDGFRFDLMGLHNVEIMNDIRSELNKLPHGENILMYGEPWRADKSNMDNGFIPALKENINYLDENISIFCDDTRDAIKGHVFYAKVPGYINGGKNFEKEIRSAVMAMCDNSKKYHPKSPKQIISYVSAHDNYTLYDKLIETMKDDKNYKDRDNLLIDINKLAAAIIFTCQGIVFMQAGEEFARTKYGEENSYNLSPEINMIDWKRVYEYSDLVEYYKGLINIRQKFSVLSSAKNENLNKIKFDKQQYENVISYTLKTNKSDEYKELFISYNSSNQDVILNLSEGEFIVLLNKESSNLEDKNLIVSKKINLKSHSALILGKK